MQRRKDPARAFRRSLSSSLLTFSVLFSISGTYCWTSTTTGRLPCVAIHHTRTCLSATAGNEAQQEHQKQQPSIPWISLLEEDDDAVKIRVIEDSDHPIAGETFSYINDEEDEDRLPGTRVTVSYEGTIADLGWRLSQNIIDCWLEDQIVDDDDEDDEVGLALRFTANEVTSEILLDETVFTEEYVFEELCVPNRAQGEQLLEGARQLRKDYQEHPPGKVFDNAQVYTFTLGKSVRLPRGMEIAASSLKYFREGTKVELLCRSDFAYGKDGLCDIDGNVMVPPYATVLYRINVQRIVDPDDELVGEFE